MKLVFVIILSVLCFQNPTISNVALEDFIFSEQELPRGCKLKPILSSDKLPCGIQSNPFISSDSDFLVCFMRMMHLGSTLVPDIEKGLFSVYEDTSEIGIFGLETSSPEVAKQIKKDMLANNPNDPNGKIFLSENILIYLWQDQARNQSFNEIEQLIKTKLD
ncbi:hypothetical protein KXJ69_06980 [Aureisphaera sp. CAU 1614]|uniref:Uncharacterized protein n=1 Tax=Halomarinibacterium sedimenti TaxID=2857106 RepID=A0A9X1JZZ1_9FLAO|nr:hypothetical protein [Halomarinibacterium sedimenti]MBW2937846.1 hypothetical protein [Halomarinibacterium sedimenti]